MTVNTWPGGDAVKSRLAGRTLFIALVALCVGPVGLQSQDLPRARPPVPDTLSKTSNAWKGALMNGDYGRAIEFYAEDAVVLVEPGRHYRGRSEILDGFLRSEFAAASSEAPGMSSASGTGVVVGDGVVTMAGLYSSFPGAAGMYSNTWMRQDDGTWKLAVSVLTIEARGEREE